MADEKRRSKVGYGLKANVPAAIQSGKIDQYDIIFTTDTKEAGFILADGTPIYVKSRNAYDNEDDAKADGYAGQVITVLVNGKYKPYVLQQSDSGLVLGQLGDDNTKQYVIVGTRPEAGQEQGVVYIDDNIGYIWTGSEWKKVFEDVSDSLSDYEERIGKLETESVTKEYVQQAIAALKAEVPIVVDEENPFPTTGYKAGQKYVLAATGTYFGQACEIGDVIFVVKDYSADSASDNDAIVLQANINGAVVGPQTAEDGDIVSFDGATGKLIKSSGLKTSDLSEVVDWYVNQYMHKEPYAYGNYFFANGHNLTIDQVDDTTNKATYFFGGEVKEVTFKASSDTVILGGCMDSNCHSSSIVVNSGTIGIIHGGGYGEGDVSDVTIVINGGNIENIYGGGMQRVEKSNHANHVGSVKIIVNHIDSKLGIFGGGYSYANVGNTEIIVNDGDFSYITGGGSNGTTGYAKITFNGGSVDCIQGVNRGVVGNADLTVNGGTVTALYVGVEPGDGATGTIGHATLHILGGTVNKVDKGCNNSNDNYDITGIIDGEYCTGVADESLLTALGLRKVSSTVTSETVEDAKQTAIEEAKAYTDGVFTIVEF